MKPPLTCLSCDLNNRRAGGAAYRGPAEQLQRCEIRADLSMGLFFWYGSDCASMKALQNVSIIY